MMTPEDIQARRETQLVSDLRHAMSNDSCRRVLAWIIFDVGEREGGIGTGAVFAGSVRDGISAYGHQSFLAGKHDMALHVEEVIKTTTPEGWRIMRMERDAAEVEAINLMQGEPIDD